MPCSGGRTGKVFYPLEGNPLDYDQLLNLSVELGCQLMSSGAEIYRVEESVRRLLQAYGLDSPEVFAIPNCVIVSITTPQGHPITRMRRIGGHGTDIELLERCNALCRQLCAHPPEIGKAQALLSALPEQTPRYPPRRVLLAYGIAPAFFSPIFGGCISDAMAAMLAGLSVGVCLLYGGRFIGSNSFFRTAICSVVASLMSLLLVHLGLGRSLDTVTISALMVLVPGVALTNAMREIMAGDIISGLCRAAESILTGTAIAIGAAIGLAIGGIF